MQDYNQIELPEVSREQEEKNRNRKRKTTDNDECVCCKRPLNNNTSLYWVQMTTNWTMVPYGTELPEGLDQGDFPVGNGCAKKIPNNYKNKQ